MVAVATVYGRYHYAVDAAGGILVGIFAFPLGAWLSAQAERRASRKQAAVAEERGAA
jgi:membrane-associated phospholipid phosphatase